MEIVLLGDASNAHLGKLAQYDAMVDFSTSARQFEQVYVHLSFNDYAYERFCIQRWFILAEYAETHFADEAFFLFDSDVMIYADLLALQRDYLRDTDFTICHGWGPQFTYFDSVTTCRKLAVWLMETYSQPGDELERLQFSFEQRKAGGHTTGGVSDMMLVQRFYLALGPRARDLGAIDEPHPYFDENFSQSYGFLLSRRGKAVRWKGRQPFYSRSDTLALVPVGGIHFQGGEKVLMGQYYTGPFFLSIRLLAFRLTKWLREWVRIVRQ